MQIRNRIQRISSLLTLLSKGYPISTPKASEQFGVSNKIIQTDFKDYILPLFENDEILYDYSSKTYKAKTNFLNKTLFDSNELSIISILKAKSKDKYSDDDLASKVNVLFDRFESELSNRLYLKSSIEKIDDFKEEIILIKNAVESKYVIHCTYNDKNRVVWPLQILNLEGFWYLIVQDKNDDKIKTFHLNSIKNIDIQESNFHYDSSKIDLFENAITAYFKPECQTINVQLYLTPTVARFFTRKPLNKTQRVLKEYEDGSIDIELIITDFMEIIPTIQSYIPNIGIISPEELKEEIKSNIEKYQSFL